METLLLYLKTILNSKKLTAMIRVKEIKEAMEFTRPTDFEMKNGVKDESDALYSRDGKKLLSAINCYTDDRIYHVKEGTEVICDKAFMDATSFDSIILPDTLTHIGAEAFHGNNLNKMVLPASLRYIGPGAFAYSRYEYAIDAPAHIDIPILKKGIFCESARMFYSGKFHYVENMDGPTTNPYMTDNTHKFCDVSDLKKESLQFRKKQKLSPYRFLSYNDVPHLCPCCSQVFLSGKPYHNQIWATGSKKTEYPQWFCAYCGQPFYHREMSAVNEKDMVYLDYYFNHDDLECKRIESVHIVINKHTRDCEAEYFCSSFDSYSQDNHTYIAVPLYIPEHAIEALLHPDTLLRFQIAYPSHAYLGTLDCGIARGLIEYRDADNVYRLSYENRPSYGIEYLVEFLRELCKQGNNIAEG